MIKKSTEPCLLTYEYIGHYASHWWVAKLDNGGEEQTQREIAKELGISRSYVSRIEKRPLIEAVS